jgi:hypothetical protein
MLMYSSLLVEVIRDMFCDDNKRMASALIPLGEIYVCFPLVL